MRTALYRTAQWLAAPDGHGRILRLVETAREGRCLDVGCGPDSWLARAGRTAIGVDLDPAYAAACRERGVPAIVGDAATLPFADGAFDSVWCVGLLHHLPDAQVISALREMRRVTRPGGETVVFDAVPPRLGWRRPVAWLIRRLDRGAWMRKQEVLEALLGRAWECRRMTYAATGLEGLLCRTGGSDAGC